MRGSHVRRKGDPAKPEDLIGTGEKCEYEAFVTDSGTCGLGIAEISNDVERRKPAALAASYGLRGSLNRRAGESVGEEEKHEHQTFVTNPGRRSESVRVEIEPAVATAGGNTASDDWGNARPSVPIPDLKGKASCMNDLSCSKFDAGPEVRHGDYTASGSSERVEEWFALLPLCHSEIETG